MTTDIGNPIPRGTIDAEAPLVDEALAAQQAHPASDAADTVEALKAEIETLTARIAERQAEAATQLRSTVRDRPLTSLAAAALVGYVVALVLHGHGSDEKNRGFRFR